jgi:uncharacterized membrane protein YfcA
MLTHAILNLPPLAVAGLIAIFIVGGSAKGALGIGLPLISVPLTAQFLDLPAVIGLLTVPMVATNIGQALEGGDTLPAFQRLWAPMLAIVLGAWAGVHLLISIDRHLLNAAVGSTFMFLAATMLAQPRVRLSRLAERWAGPCVGLLAGMLGGTSGMFAPPLIAYLGGMDLHPDTFVKYISILFVAANGTVLLALGGTGSLCSMDLLVSAAAMIPIQLGMVIGRWLRGRCSPAWFRGLVLCALALGGLDMLRGAIVSPGHSFLEVSEAGRPAARPSASTEMPINVTDAAVSRSEALSTGARPTPATGEPASAASTAPPSPAIDAALMVAAAPLETPAASAVSAVAATMPPAKAAPIEALPVSPSLETATEQPVSSEGPASKTPQAASAVADRAPAQALRRLSAAALVTRGDGFLSNGDVVSARLFYERAAGAGDGPAALRLGETFDPAFLEKSHLRHVQGNSDTALSWYRRARDLGVGEAEILSRGTAPK